MRAGFRILASVVVASLLLTAGPQTAHALDRDKKIIITSSLYGMAAGTLMGLVATPSTRSGKSIFIGTSIGLYLGVIVGLYHLSHEDDPGNPLYTPGKRSSGLPAGPDSALMMTELERPPVLLQVEIPVAQF